MRRWTRFARRRHAPLSARLLQEAQRPAAFEAATGIERGLRDHAWIDDEIYLNGVEEAALQAAVEERVRPGDLSFVESFTDRCRLAIAELTATADSIAADDPIADRSRADLAEPLGRWIRSYRRAMSFVPVFRTIDRALASRLAPDEAALVSTAAGGLTEEARERVELRRLVARLRAAGDLDAQSEQAAALIDRHVEEFGWLRVRWHLGEPFTTDDVRRRVVALLAARAPSPAFDGAPAPRSSPPVPDFVEELAFLRSHRAEAINRAIWTARPLFTAIGRDAGLDYDEIVHLLPAELLELAAGAEPPPRELLARRRDRFATVLLDDRFEAAAGEAEVEALRARLGIDGEAGARPLPAGDRPTILRGVVASRGRARGTVRVVRVDADDDKVGVDEILVTTMTFPSLVGSMQRSAAIVTDDGGLLSHAAITARELGKPCLIDTRRATEVLADGDLVEVDCEAGYVRLLVPPSSQPEGRTPQ